MSKESEAWTPQIEEQTFREWEKRLTKLNEEFRQSGERITAMVDRVLKREKGPLVEAVAIGLRSSDVETRDAITNLVECEGLAECVFLLEAHKEDVSWLAEYMAQVVTDLDEGRENDE